MVSLKPIYLGDNTLLFRGSPTTLVYIDGEEAYVIDPGYPSSRGKAIRKALKRNNVEKIVAVITHGHPDHIAALETLEASRVISHPVEKPAIENFTYRVFSTFSLPLHKWLPLLLFEAGGYKVDEIIEPPACIGELKIFPLYSHTFGQIGVHGW